MGTEQFCLKWNNHHSNMLTVFEQLLSNEALVDVTLACEGLSMKAHKMVLSACSPFFQNLFLENPCKHPIVILKDMKYRDLKAIVDFMYRGEVNVSEDQLTALLKTAETLKVKGLAEVMYENKQDTVIHEDAKQQMNRSQLSCGNRPKENRILSASSVRRKHGRSRKHSLSDSVHSDSDSHVPTKTKEIESSLNTEDNAMECVVDEDVQHKQNTKFASRRLDTSTDSQSQSVHCNNFKMQTYSMLPSIVSKENTSVEETKSGDEVEFDIEPSKLMEQTLTENMPVFANSHPQTSALPLSSQTSSVEISGNVLDNQLCHISNNGDGSALVPVSVSVDTPTSTNEFAQEDIPDVKPENISFESTRLSPIPGPSQQQKDKSNSVVSYLDNSMVPAIPGPSNYQSENSQVSFQQQHGQDCISSLVKTSNASFQNLQKNQSKLYEKKSKSLQEKVRNRPFCPVCLKSFFDASNLRRHMEIHYYQRKNYICQLCTRRFSWKTHLMTHIRTCHVTETSAEGSGFR
ncbi:protein tramtrack, beta isoform-like isoform X1 [Centruroides sculpturatus]|uniref:protein tramtrack, beta isoform-like isoform X1 n=1 Tax=Centruroides sculpturatus TaxID=218467 RepID=UPI000C6D272C|nr:protein tramtrack, beta isoform-like isoform X1 [Centruroides sculpturatus]